MPMEKLKWGLTCFCKFIFHTYHFIPQKCFQDATTKLCYLPRLPLQLHLRSTYYARA